MQNFFKFLFTILLITIPFTNIYALDTGFYSTISLSIDSIGKEGIEYNQNDIVGDTVYDAILTKNLDYLTNDGYKRRVYNQYQYVALPPYSKIAIGYYWYNNTPDTVNVDTIRIPVSREIEDQGDVTDILFDSNFQQGKTCSPNICRDSKYLEVDGVGLLSSDMYKDPKHGVVISRLTINPPVEITKYEIEYINEYSSKIKLYVRNNTKQHLDNIWINFQGSESAIFDLEGYEEISFDIHKRCDLLENSINCGPVKIIDKNRNIQCFMYGSTWDDYLNPDSVTVFNKVNDEWISGAMIQPSLDSFCIERIPYRYTTEDMIVSLEQEPEPVTKEQYWRDLLNIELLPITSYRFNILNNYLTLLKPLGIDTL